MADPERYDADPDPTFHADGDPDPAPDTDPNFFLSRVRKVFVKIFNYVLFSKSYKTYHV